MSAINQFLKTFFFLLLVVTLVSCASDSADEAGGDPDCGSCADTDNAFSVAFPSALVIASPTAQTQTDANALVRAATVAPSATFEEKLEALESILSGTTIEDCDFAFDIGTNTENAACYGPTLTYANHPDHADPDADDEDNDTEGDPNDSDGDGTLPGGDLGIWRENEADSTEACAAAQLNQVVERAASQIDSVVYAMASILCIANVNELEVPEDGTTLDMTSEVAEGFTANEVDLEVDNATLAREDSDSTSTYTSTLSGTGTDDFGNEVAVNCRLKHRDDANGVTYAGKLSCTVAVAEDTKPGNCNSGEVTETGYTDALSISYQKNSETIFTAEVNSGNFCGASGVDPYVSATNFTVDASKKLNLAMDPGDDLTTGWGNNYHYARYQLNSNTGAGQYRIAWQAGRNDGYARVLQADMDAVDGDGNKGGCAYFAYGPDMEESTGDLDGMICNWAGPGHTMPKTQTETVQQQCMDYNATTGVYESDSAELAISYAPTNSCDSTGVDGDGNVFSYSDGVTEVDGAVTNDLVDLISIPDIDPPSPEDVDA